MKQLMIVLAALGLYLAAKPNRADAQDYFMRGYVVNYNNPFHIDSTFFYNTPRNERYQTYGWGWVANAMDSFTFRASAWPSAIKCYMSRNTMPVQVDSIQGIRGRWYNWHYVATWESCLVMFDTVPPEGVQESKPGSTLRPELSAATPNPFATFTTIGFANPKAQPVELTVYNLAGQPVRTLVAGYAPAGSGRTVWNGTDDAGRALESGIYFCRLTASGRTLTEKLILDR